MIYIQHVCKRQSATSWPQCHTHSCISWDHSTGDNEFGTGKKWWTLKIPGGVIFIKTNSLSDKWDVVEANTSGVCNRWWWVVIVALGVDSCSNLHGFHVFFLGHAVWWSSFESWDLYIVARNQEFHKLWPFPIISPTSNWMLKSELSLSLSCKRVEPFFCVCFICKGNIKMILWLFGGFKSWNSLLMNLIVCSNIGLSP